MTSGSDKIDKTNNTHRSKLGSHERIGDLKSKVVKKQRRRKVSMQLSRIKPYISQKLIDQIKEKHKSNKPLTFQCILYAIFVPDSPARSCPNTQIQYTTDTNVQTCSSKPINNTQKCKPISVNVNPYQ